MSLDAAHSACARSFFVAAERGDRAGMQRALASLAPILEPPLRRTLHRHDTLLRRCRLEREDVVQRVFEQLLASPPSNPSDREPIAVLVAWAKTVAIHHLLDLSRRIGREDPDASADDHEGRPGARAPQERQHEAAERWRLVRVFAHTELVRYKYLRELFDAIAEEPELGARELAWRIGLLDDASPAAIDEAAVRRAEQYVWKLRERVQRKLADHLEALDSQPPSGTK